MYWQLESMGIEPSESLVVGLLRAALHEGKAYRAYTKGWIYINHWFGSMQLSAHIREPHDGQKGEVCGSNLHVAGSFPYQLKVISALAPTDCDDPLERRILAQTANDEGSTLVVNIVNADRLPCWKDGTVVTVQMIAKALSLNVYKDENEYCEKTSFPVSRKEINNGEEFQMTAAVGSVLPEGFLGLHMIRDGQEPEPEPEDLLEESRMVLTGRVESTRYRDLVLGDDQIRLFYALVETNSLGKVEMYADFGELTKEELSILRPGAIIRAAVTFSADTILNEKETGLPLSAQNNYALLADVFEYPHRFDRLWGAMAEDCIYRSEGAEAEIQGKDKILAYLHQKEALLQDPEERYHSDFAVLTEAADNLPHKAGEHCVVLRKGEGQKYMAIVFLSMDDSDQIREIHLSVEPGYRFKTVPYDEWTEAF